ncbi:cytochrome oxidase maturation protein, cbb3-type [Bernardetia litoralis DSM 6794]|uniref:Cytochrome oxidase maturation protein, cbb3-type n=1 Tax=Bernardetia litoralis (strain ATCC 23117 / DSM 6794 / NBRC 15988 / NCIMB 1366 / Fx l1 / Sio-4) TaxID=880071 RepID=I4AGM5_BERLS|nr:cbb3-type cytochrome oxidase assembly protein CcoS [Bernardetia litoralis]AFM03110.1 cytochrome oxidase maturation protein, cbb3-type [Bernardetia litoralis DSM 6794]
MQVLIVLVICSLVVALGFLAAFFWSVKDNQYEDTYTPSMRILFDDNEITAQNKESKEIKK